MKNQLYKYSRQLIGLGTGNERSNLIKKNISASFIIKGLNILIGLVLVPMTINYIDPTRYGIWITISSIVAWFGFFNIGLDNGLRNRFTEALAKGNNLLARVYVSTTYALLIIIITIVLFLFFVISPLINWNIILNADFDIISNKELNLLVIIVITFFCIQFVLKLITTILTADQKPALASIFDLFGKILSLIIIFILIKTTTGNLIYLGIALSSTSTLVLLASSIWFYRKKYKIYRPSFKYIDFSKSKDLLNLGLKFFFIQIAGVLLYQTNNIIISQLFGPENVTPYNISFKYFSVLMMVFSIIMTPLWSAFTDAWVKMEIEWIKRIMKKLFRLWGLLVIVGLFMLLISQFVYDFWIGDKVQIPFLMSLLIVLWVLINTWNGIFSQFLNGVGKIKLQMYLGLIAAIINIPLSIFLGKEIGIEGVLSANLIVLIAGIIIYPIQYNKIINNRASGIWNK